MAPAFRTSANGQNGSTAVATIVPVVGDHFVVFCCGKGSTVTPVGGSVTDDNGGTYSLIGGITTNSSLRGIAVFVRDQALANTTSTNVTWTPDQTCTGTIITVHAASGMTVYGAASIVQSKFLGSQAAASTPAPVFTTAVNTNNITYGMVGNGTNPAGLTPPTNWTERADFGVVVPAGLETVSRDSGFTGTTVTWGSTSATAYAAALVELKTSATFSATAALALTEAITIAASNNTLHRTTALTLTEAVTIAAAHTTSNRAPALSLVEAVTVAASHWTKQRVPALTLTEAVTIAAANKTLHRSSALSLVEVLTIAASHSTANRRPALGLTEAVTIAASHKTMHRVPALSLVEALTVLYSVAFQPGPKASWYYNWYGPRGYVFTDGWWGLTPDGNTNKAVGRMVSALSAPNTYTTGLAGETYRSALVTIDTLLSLLGD